MKHFYKIHNKVLFVDNKNHIEKWLDIWTREESDFVKCSNWVLRKQLRHFDSLEQFLKFWRGL